MATIAGPKVQVPDTRATPVTMPDGTVHPAWAVHFHTSQQILFAATRSGPSSSRPTNKLDGRWIGMPYFDTTLGRSVYLKSTNPDVWVDGSGSVV